jgi:hypothetical protein
LYLRLLHICEIDALFVAIDIEGGGGEVAAHDATGGRTAVYTHNCHESANVAAPVARQGQGAIDAARRHLERVQRLAHHLGRVHRPCDGLGHHPDIVECHAIVAVDEHPDQPATAYRTHLDVIEVEPAFANDRVKQRPKLVQSRIARHGGLLGLLLSGSCRSSGARRASDDTLRPYPCDSLYAQQMP